MKITTLIAAAAFALTAMTAQAGREGSDGILDETPSATAMVADFLIVRPLGLVSMVIGTTVFVAQLPFAVFMKDGASNTAQKLVVEPAQFTFSRPLGQMD